MLIRIGRDHRPRLEEADNFRGFKVVIDVDRGALSQCQAGFTTAGKLENDQHAWVNADWLRAEASMSDEPAWQEGMARMLEFARTKGWLSPDGSIRAHVEWTGG
jgi:hypothetical protein